MPSSESFSLSALFEIKTTNAEILSLAGGPVLTQKAGNLASTEVKFDGTNIGQRRAPAVRIEGSCAEKVGQDTIIEYSRYIAALFDNFD